MQSQRRPGLPKAPRHPPQRQLTLGVGSQAGLDPSPALPLMTMTPGKLGKPRGLRVALHRQARLSRPAAPALGTLIRPAATPVTGPLTRDTSILAVTSPL